MEKEKWKMWRQPCLSGENFQKVERLFSSPWGEPARSRRGIKGEGEFC